MLRHHADFKTSSYSARDAALASVRFLTPSQGDTRYNAQLRVEVRFGSTRLTEYGNVFACTLRITEAFLTLKLVDCDIPPGTERLGDREQASDMKGHMDQRNKSIASTKTGFSAAIKAGKNVLASLGAHRSNDHSNEAETKLKTEISRKRVAALSGDRWKFQEPLGGFLEGRFAGGFDEDCLCNIVADGGNFSVAARLTAFPKNIIAVDVSPPKLGKKLENASLEHQRLVALAIARGLVKRGEIEIELATSLIQTSEDLHG